MKQALQPQRKLPMRSNLFARCLTVYKPPLVVKEALRSRRKQWQHIAIARALLKNSPILILDEIPAAHELDSDHRLSSALGLLMQNRTVLIFCQKIPHLRKIDRQAVFKHGRVTENANGSQLIQ
jgi:ABC-type transport system involved in Fe-S cluster assembly fused permease/ATPase subunit